MKNHIKETDLAIITTEPLSRSFANEDVYMHAVIELVADNNHAKTRKYRVRTDFALYKPVVRYSENEAGELVEQNVFALTIVEQKQDWATIVFSYDEINAFADQISAEIPESLSRIDRDTLELKTMFLKLRQESMAWGVAPEKWKIRTTEDLIKTEL